MEFIDEKLDRYVCHHTSVEPDYLQRLNRETHLKIKKPRMLSGHFQGRVLSLLSKLVNPQHILEIGTYTGYSALCLAEGLKEGGQLYTIDVNEELEDIVNKYIIEAGFQGKIKTIIGDAAKEISKLDLTFDLVFIDADKINYELYYDQVFDKVNKGGVIVFDNVLWSGKVIEENLKTTDKDTPALMKLNDRIQNDNRVENVLLPIRDGLMVLRKL